MTIKQRYTTIALLNLSYVFHFNKVKQTKIPILKENFKTESAFSNGKFIFNRAKT